MQPILFVVAVVLLIIAAFNPPTGRVSLALLGAAAFVLAYAWPLLTVTAR